MTETRTDAFTRLGTPVPETDKTNAEAALRATGLYGWNVRKIDAYGKLPGGKLIKAVGRNIVVRGPEDGPVYMGDVGRAHTTMQNEDQIEFLDVFRREAGATFETAGTDRRGGRVFVTMRLPGAMMIGGQDRVDTFLTSINAHDGSMQHTIYALPNRYACMNMLQLALRNHTHAVKVRHTVNAPALLKVRVHEMLDTMFEYLDEFKALAEKLAETPLTQKRFEEIVYREFGPKEDASARVATIAENKVAEMSRLFADAQTQAGIRDSAWAGLNALTEWADHYSPVRTKEDPALVRAEKALFDTGFKDRALALMMKEMEK